VALRWRYIPTAALPTNWLTHKGTQEGTEKKMYKYEVMDPRNIPAAQAANDWVFANPVGVLGIEVTIPALASRCNLGNIDPQHTGGDPNESAIEAAITAPLPKDGATLATVRADLDSIGAMAVIAYRLGQFPGVQSWLASAPAFGNCPVCTGRLSEDAKKCVSCDWTPGGYFFEAPAWEGFRNRLKLVAEADRFARGGYAGPKPLPSTANPWPEESATAESYRPLAAIAAAVADFRVPVAARVWTMLKWLNSGEEPEGYRTQVEEERADMIAALENGTIKANATENGKIAVVVSTHRAATSVGYALAPVVVALNPSFRFQGGEPHTKFTVCQFTGGFVDLKSAVAELATLEAGWGGSPTIIGSPQGVSSILTIEKVIEIVAKYTK
jgi:hypothetical protein